MADHASPIQTVDEYNAAAQERGQRIGVFMAGDVVRKVSGYRWPGVIVASFFTLGGKRRYVVECTVPEVAGALHIFSAEQLERDGGVNA
jgi:hypothetical protein